MKIVKLEAENIKRLVAVEIEPDGSLVPVTGGNGAGKSSVLDAIWWALAGERGIQSAPIRSGEQHARISLDLGDLIVTREFARKDDDSTTTRIRVENAEGARYPSPQTMLDGLLGSLTFDPLFFQRASDRQQVEMLAGLCGVDVEAIDRATADDAAARREANREAKRTRTLADAIHVPDDTPDEPVSMSDIARRMRDAEAANREREGERRRREQEQARADRMHHESIEISRRAEQAGAHYLREAEDLERRAREVREIARRDAQQSDERSVALTSEADGIVEVLASLPPVEPDIDTSALQQEIADAERVNEHVRAARRKRDLMDQHKAAARTADDLTAQMGQRRQQMRDKIAAANLGVDGLTVAQGRVMLGEHPFEQASDAERLRASCAIAMRGDAKLRVLRVRYGSLLDEHSLRLLGEMAEAADYQVWIEMVDTSGKVGIVIEDGQVKR